MLVLNTLSDHGRPLEEADTSTLSPLGADAASRWIGTREEHRETPLLALAALAAELGVAALHVEDEGRRLGFGSFKALGGAYAVACLVLEEASRRLGRTVGFEDLRKPEVTAVASTMTVACATDGNHGRSVAQGAKLARAGVGVFAAAVAGHMALVLGERRATVVVVDPQRAACLLEGPRAGHPVKVDHGEPTVMVMLECYEPSLVAWRVLSRVADAFMTVDEDDAVAVMNHLSRPLENDSAVVACESGGAGLAGLVVAMSDPDIRRRLGLDAASRVLVINTEGATDPSLYKSLVGLDHEWVSNGKSNVGAAA